MSEVVKPNGKPVKPPIANIGINPSAKSIGVLNRIDAPYKVIGRAVKIITDGIEMIIVVVWKNVLIAVPIPVMNI